MDRSSSLTPPNKKRRSSRLNATPLRKQPMRSCRRRATEVNDQEDFSLAAAVLIQLLIFGQVISSVISTSACLDERIESKILSLPKEIMVNILILLPADVLYDIMRYLCFQWYKIICDPVFIKAHLRRSSAAGLFIQYEKAPYNSFYVDTGMRDCKVMRINFQISCQVWASCDGLVLISDRCDRSILYIANPITKQQVTLPPFKWSRDGYYFALARARSTGEYKVVGTYKENNGFYCGILNVGKDRTWRTVDTQHISEDMQRIFKYPPQSTGGYVYWAIRMWSNLLTLDVEAEVLLEFPVPKPDMLGWEIWYMAMGNFLGCMFWDFKAVLVGVLDFEVLVLADPKTGEWKNRYKFDLNGKREMISLSLFKEAYPQTRLDLQPVAWVNNGEVLVCTTYDRRCKSYIAHNVETGETYSFDLYKKNNHPFWCPHVNSLASLDLPK
ncbi:hypothetical protein Vadar_025393 [Vaccinium darrowii]|uniref:Uncharacterized protein n=1 Tax=Vaccinium darrowii TaxID=229202 RepID=A0ACB7XK45_9ERIC|nr:hypothetical protein Vadar_025393 [Vaccinium darrowii]